MVEFSDLAFHFRALKGLDDDALEEVLDFLFGKTVTREKAELASLFRAHRAYSTVAQSRDSSTGNILIDVFGLVKAENLANFKSTRNCSYFLFNTFQAVKSKFLLQKLKFRSYFLRLKSITI
jgi:hypothetical protein